MGTKCRLRIWFENRIVLLFLFDRASSPDRIEAGARKTILVKLSWPLWLMCGLYVEELPRKRKMTEQWLLYTNWRRAAYQHGYLWCSSVHKVLFFGITYWRSLETRLNSVAKPTKFVPKPFLACVTSLATSSRHHTREYKKHRRVVNTSSNF